MTSDAAHDATHGPARGSAHDATHGPTQRPAQRSTHGPAQGSGRGATGDLWVTRRLSVPASELSWRFSHSGGPGGQGVNTSDSRVELSWDIARSRVLDEDLQKHLTTRLETRLVRGVLTVRASEERSQLRNREIARTRLAGILARALAPAPKARRPTTATRGSKERRLGAKKRRGDVKAMRRRPQY